MRAIPCRSGDRASSAIGRAVVGFWAACLASSGFQGTALADPPAAPAQPAVPVRVVGAPAEKRIAFEMRDKPWSSVLEWLSDQTGLPVITTHKPTGTFNFISPKNKTYTIPEIIDILNEGLLSQKYLLIRRDQSFTLVPADEKIDPAILPRVRVEDLLRRGNTEMVSVVLPLTSLVAEDLAPEVRKMMGPFGEVVAMAKANQLVLQDTAGNVKRIVKTIKEVEDNEKGQAESFSHTCQYIKARDAEQIVSKLLGDPREMIRLTQPQQQPGFPGFGRPAPAPAPAPAAATAKIRMHYVTADERTNTVLVTGPADKIAQARDILKRIDVAQQGQPPVLLGPATLKTYPVPGGTAEALAKTLSEIYKNSSTIRITNAGNSAILVWAGPDDQIEIAKHIIGSTEKSTKTEMIPLNELDASKIADTLKGMFGDVKTGAPYVEADTTRNAVVIRGTAEQVNDVKAVLQAMGAGSGAGGNMRVITLDKGSAATLAEALGRLLPQMRQNPVNVVIPGKGESRPAPPPAPKPADRSNGGSEEQEPKDGKEENGQQLKDPQKKAAQSEKPGEQNSPVTITAFGNRLIVTSDDPKALALVQELTRLLMQTPGGEGDFEVIKLKNASATEVAKVLDEAFNNTKPQSNQQQQGFPFGGFGRRGGPAPEAPNPSANRLRVVADPATNSLLVRASPLDMITVRRLLDTALDTGETQSKAIAKTWIIGPLKYANATEVANVIRDVYREHLNNNPRGPVVGGFGGVGGFGFFRGNGGLGGSQNANVDANGNPRAVTLSVGVDDRTNSLVVSCSSALYEDVKKLTEQLDLAAKDSTRTVRVVSTKGLDPLLVQQAIDAMQGRRTPQQPGANTGQPNSPGFVPAGTGGLVVPGASPFRGGGGGRGMGPPGSGQSSAPERGPGFFVERVTDDPQPSLLYDPQLSSTAREESPAPGLNPAQSVTLQFTSLEEEQPPPPQPAQPPAGGAITGPRAPVTAEALEQLGVVVISGNNQADVEEVIRIIEMLQKLGAGAEVQIQLVPLEHADATSVTNTLSQLFQRVIIGTASSSVSRPTTTTTQTAFGGQAQSTQATASSVVLISVPRLNAILVGAPKARVEDIVKEIKRLDQPLAAAGKAQPFQLKKASAARVASLLTNFYAGRYANETTAQDQVRVTYDDSTNTVFVQAAPADLAEIRDLIWRMDNTVSEAVNDLRIVPLRNVLADEMAAILQQAISQGLVAPAPAPGIVPAVGGAAGARGPGAAPAGVTPTAAPAGAATKGTSLRFVSPEKGARPVKSGLLEDIHITSDTRINALIISAPEKSMDLLTTLIRELDVLPALRAEISIFPLRKADATSTAALLQQLFLGTGGPPPGTPSGVSTGVGGAGGGVAPQAAAAPFAASGSNRPMTPVTLTGVPPEGAPLIELRITVDQRTNSIIAAGSRNDLVVIEAIISRLEDADVQARKNDVYTLRNAASADVATALTNFLSSSLRVLQLGQQLTAFQEIEREVVVVPEPITNKLLISATPRYFDEILRLVQQLDAAPPQVVIQALIAEVDLNNTDEFGVELGLQSPVLFRRGIIPDLNFLGPSGSINYTNPGLVPQGVTVNSSINPAALPGFAFNNVTTPPGNNPVVEPGVVGFQGISNLGVGRSSPTNSGIGGFVFSANSDAFSLLIRALKTQGRIDILSRPQITTLDNQQSQIVVGQSVPYVQGANISTLGNVTPIINYRNVGIVLQVTPRISPDGKVILRVHPEVSSLAATQINLGNGILATEFNDEFVDTTVVAEDGETVAIGGLISKHDTKTENKVPWFGDLPGIGVLFRFRQQQKNKSEVMIILTPHIVRSRFDADAILAQESRRMDWVVGDVVKIHGTTGLEPILPSLGGPDACGPGVLPATPVPPAGSTPGTPAPVEALPPPRSVPPVSSSGQSPTAPTGGAAATRMPGMNMAGGLSLNGGQPDVAAGPSGALLVPAAPSPVSPATVAPTDQGTEARRWNVLPRN